MYLLNPRNCFRVASPSVRQRRRPPIRVAGVVLLSVLSGACDGQDVPCRGLAAGTGVTGDSPGWPGSQVCGGWHWQLTGEPDLSVEAGIYDIDLMESGRVMIDRLKSAGREVVCYFSAGTLEQFRSIDSGLHADAVGNALPDWPDENWLDIRQPSVRDYVQQRLGLAAEKGCDAVEPDNVDAWVHDTGFELTREDQLAFNRWLAHAAHQQNLLVGLKNALSLIPELVDDFDFAINEQCHEYQECEALLPFVESGKVVLQVEYRDHKAEAESSLAGICADSAILGLTTLLLPPSLDHSFRYSCQ